MKFTMTYSSPDKQSDFLEAAALQKLIIAAMKAATEKRSQELAVLLRQICERYNAASLYVRSEVEELMQELKNLIGEFETAPFVAPSVHQVPARSKSRAMGFAFVGIAAIVALSAVGFRAVQTNTIAPSSSGAVPTVACTEVNPDRVRVEAYTRKNGTPVKAHERTMPNQSNADNLSCPR